MWNPLQVAGDQVALERLPNFDAMSCMSGRGVPKSVVVVQNLSDLSNGLDRDPTTQHIGVIKLPS